MHRTNTFDVDPRTDRQESVLYRMLDASASLWNEVTYVRRQQFFDGGSVWAVETDPFYNDYMGVLGGATARTVIRQNDVAWNSFYELRDLPDEQPNPPGYWGNEAEGRDLRTYVRTDRYTLVWGARSRLDLTIGQELKDEFGFGPRERLRLPVRGRPAWTGDQGRLVIEYDAVADTYRAYQAVTVPDDERASPRGANMAALDIGANNLVACATTTGWQYLYAGRDCFAQFRATTRAIADAQAKLPDGQHSSIRITRLYRTRTRRRNHAQDALVRDLVERLHDQDVATIIVGDVTGVLDTHWSVTVNEKTHAFWAFRRFRTRLETVAEEYGIDVRVRSEAWTSQRCPRCGHTDTTTRTRDRLTCACGFVGHADLTAARTLLASHADHIARPMVRPVRFQWDDHEWCPIGDATGRSNELRTNP